MAILSSFTKLSSRSNKKSKARTITKPKVSAYHCVELVIPYDACDAAMELHGKRFLSAEAPTLPLPGCGQTCGCRFKHHNDRRHEERRDPFSSSALHSIYAENKNRRLGGDRRHSVTNGPRLY